jgi:TFIIF-interacting CTD phosphatase-like protein
MPNKDLNLILDLDQTIILTQEFPISILTENIIEILRNDPNYLLDFSIDDNIYFTFTRNGLVKFIETLDNYFNIFVFTAGNFTYAKLIIDKINTFFKYNIIATYPDGTFYKKQKNIINKFWFNDHLLDGKKDLSITGLDPDKTIIVDDNIDVWIQPIYHIKPFALLYFIHENNQLLKTVQSDYELNHLLNDILIDFSLVFN